MSRSSALLFVVGVATAAGVLTTSCRSNRESTRTSESTTSSTSTRPRPDDLASHPAPKGGGSESRYESDMNGQQFVDEAAQGGMFEVESSRMALEKAHSEKVREFARMMVDDHGKANDELESLASGKSIRVSRELDSKHRQKLDELGKLDGPEFDRKYLECQAKAHDDAIALFQRAARDCDDADLKAFAKRTLPTLQKHRTHLEGSEIQVSGK